MTRLWGGLTILVSWSGNVLAFTLSAPSTLAGFSLCLTSRGIPSFLGRLRLPALSVSKKDPQRDG